MSKRGLVLLALLSFLLTLAGEARASRGDGAAAADRTLSPYFFVSGEAGEESLALEASTADIRIAGVIADVVVTQRYKNDGEQPISARYVFPASSRAAVYGMKMTIGDRTIEAKIKKREQARQEYEAARRAGKSASLLEQDRPNVFTMNVANIMPGDEVRVELRYTELIKPTGGVYELVYPTVVGPRYSGEGAEIDRSDATSRHVATPYTRAGAKPMHRFALNARIAAGMPVFDVDSPSHRIQTATGADKSVSVKVPDAGGGNRDFILRYRLAGDELASGLMLYRGAKESFYLMMVQPPRRPEPETIPAREYVFIVDVSGSMRGFPLEVTGKLMKDLLGKLRPGDRFNVMLFSGGSSLLAEDSLPATQQNLTRAIDLIENTDGGGGTSLLPALERALALPADTERSRTFVVVTDGYIAAERAAFETVRGHLGEANLFAFGIGSSVNRHLVEGLARAGLGVPFVATGEKEAARVADAFREYIESPVLTRVRVAHRGFAAYDQQPAAIPDVFADRPVVVFGKWKGEPSGTIELTGVSGRGRFVSRIDVGAASQSPQNRALEYLWARSRIATLSDFGAPSEADKAQITALGLKHNLLTELTSFIAVHHVVSNASGRSDQVVVPQPMPQGVADSAIGGITAGPEPELAWLLGGLLALALLLAARRRRGARR
jgi:Ca-activated chloride channel family protein